MFARIPEGTVRARYLIVALLPLMEPRLASADPPCSSTLAPASISLRDTGLDQNRVACGVDGLGIGGRLLAKKDTASLEEQAAALFVDYRYLHLSGIEFSLAARLLTHKLAEGGIVSKGQTDAGPISLGVLRPQRTTWWGIPAVTAHSFRLEVPMTDTTYSSVTVGASPAVLATLMPSKRLHLHGRMAALLWSVLPESGADSQAALLASSDLAYAPFSAFAVTGGAESQVGWYGLGLDHVLLRGGLRVAVGNKAAFALEASRVVAGSEDNDTVLWIGYQSMSRPAQKPTKSRLQEWAQ